MSIEKKLETETRISLCIMENRNWQRKEHGIKYCTLETEHNCPHKEKAKYLKAYETIIIEYPICNK